ncbi:hypothetical protein RhiirA4_445270 [Rhizophagus irregularis]|uniref:K Homology domain-containing protein n=1 Tax=Rhizophagus irregularis TaxID=588596 RepID=A0A2I1GNX5_9GLOM|nr:hypothetical protein RhiirA4_445270 [Rhizophagus irregularis]
MQSPTKIKIPKIISFGRLIGPGGCNLKPIEEETGTHIYVITDAKPPHIEVKINEKITLLSCKDRIKEASDKLKELMKTIDLEMKNRQKNTVKKKVNNNNHKENHYEKSKRWKENNLKRERIASERK